MKLLFLESFKSKSAWFFGIILYLIIGTLGYTYVLSLENPVKVKDVITKRIIVKQGCYFQLCRKVTYNRDVSATLSRKLTMENEEGRHIVDYPSVAVVREKGTVTRCRNIKLPKEMDAGIWAVHTYIDVYTPPFWHTNFEVKPFKIEVIKGDL